MTKVDIFIPKVLEPRYLTLCTRFVDVLDYDRLNRETKHSFSYTNGGAPEDNNQIREIQHQLSVKEIFDYTPHEKEIIDDAYFRTSNSIRQYRYASPEVYKYFNISKFVIMEHICYMINKVNDTPHLYEKMALTPVGSGLIFALNLSKALKRSNNIRLIVSQGVPFRSIVPSATVYRGYNDTTGSAKLNHFSSYSFDNRVVLLPAPYETNCFDYHTIGLSSEIHCAHTCTLQKTLERYKKVPFSVIIQTRMNERMISYLDVDHEDFTGVNDTINAKDILEIQDNCTNHPLCRRNSCDHATQITVTHHIHALSPKFKLILDVPGHPSYFLISRPATTIVEYLTHILSVMSTYTGLSIIGMNPMIVLKKLPILNNYLRNKGSGKKVVAQNSLGLEWKICIRDREVKEMKQRFEFEVKRIERLYHDLANTFKTNEEERSTIEANTGKHISIT